MSFFLSKVVWLVTAPHAVMLLLSVLGVGLLWTKWRRLGRGLVTFAVGFTLLAAVVPLGRWVQFPLDNRFPPMAFNDLPPNVDGIVVLGGAVDQFVSRERGRPSLSGAAERMTEAVLLARHYPDAKLLFTGGSGVLARQDVKETEVARVFFTEFGIDERRLMLESDSRNTWENAVYSLDMARPGAAETWLLVTSSSHMPRSVGCFRKAGWEIVPYPVDFATGGFFDDSLTFNPNGLGNLAAGLHEWVGLAAYWVMGRTDALFPAPQITE